MRSDYVTKQMAEARAKAKGAVVSLRSALSEAELEDDPRFGAINNLVTDAESLEESIAFVERRTP